ncbi:MAG: dockerin type I repeat-containing protein [Muribaculaceae bacterium]|nr:dockerin type I repeat-containing protein [Muribaculaceae bacterium]
MKIVRLFLLMIVLGAGQFLASAQEEIATFSRSSFVGWEYNANIDLNAQNIGRGRIVLYKVSEGNERKLSSPYFDCSQADSLRVDVVYRPMRNSENQFPIMQYLTLKVALFNYEGEEVCTKFISMPEEMPDTLSELDLSTTIEAPAGSSMHQLQFTAPYANIDNCGAMMEVHVFAVKEGMNVIGDVNGDSIVDVEDVNAAINIILKLKTAADYSGNADIDGNGYVDVSDVNEIINIILKN